MITLLHVACWAWGGWIAFNLLMVVLCATVMPVHQVCFDGFRIRIPGWLPGMLSAPELAAVVAHEEGHRRHLHTWSNLALRCLFLLPGHARRQRQEHEADDHAAALGHSANLAAALRKLSNHPDDLARAARLEGLQRASST